MTSTFVKSLFHSNRHSPDWRQVVYKNVCQKVAHHFDSCSSTSIYWLSLFHWNHIWISDKCVLSHNPHIFFVVKWQCPCKLMLILSDFVRLCLSQTSWGSHINYCLICWQIKHETASLELVKSNCLKSFCLNSFLKLAPKWPHPSPVDTKTQSQRNTMFLTNILIAFSLQFGTNNFKKRMIKEKKNLIALRGPCVFACILLQL